MLTEAFCGSCSSVDKVLHKQEGLNSMPRPLWKTWVHSGASYNQRNGEPEAGGFLGLADRPAQPNQQGPSLRKSKTRWIALKNDAKVDPQPAPRGYTHTHTHTCAHGHTHAHTLADSHPGTLPLHHTEKVASSPLWAATVWLLTRNPLSLF